MTEVRKTDILASMEFDIEYKVNEIAKIIGLQPSRTRELLKMLVEEGRIIALGERKSRKYVRK